MGKPSREKGKRGERERGSVLCSYGYDTCPGQQYCGNNGEADVIGLPGLHIECKRVEKLNLADAMSQAIADTRPGEKPCVMHRRNNAPWLVTIRLDEFMEIYREWEPIQTLQGLTFEECLRGMEQERESTI